MRSLLVLVAASSLGCAGIVGIDDWDPGSPAAADGSATTSSSTGANSTTDGPQGGGGSAKGAGGSGGQGGSGGASCSTTTVIATLVSDVLLAPGGSEPDCAQGAEPSINYGVDPLVNLGVGHGLLRFGLTPAAIAAIGAGATVELEVSRAPDCYGDPCPAIDGTFDVYPMRNDWKEGTQSGANVDGATWCEADPKADVRWDDGGADGPGDRGALAGSVFAAAGDSVVTWTLPTLDASWIDPSKNELALLLMRQSGVLVVSTRENPAAPAPLLRVTWCD